MLNVILLFTKRLHFIGILLVMGATVLFMLAMSFISQGYPWESPLIVVSENKDVIVDWEI